MGFNPVCLKGDTMTDILSFINVLFAGAWDLFTEIQYPGTGMTIGVIMIGAFLIVLSMKLLGYLLGFSFSDTSGYRSGGRANAKISNNRKGDEN